MISRTCDNTREIKQVPAEALAAAVAVIHIFPFKGDATAGADGKGATAFKFQHFCYLHRNAVQINGREGETMPNGALAARKQGIVPPFKNAISRAK